MRSACDHARSRNRRGVSENRDQVAVASGFDPQHSEAILGVVNGDAIAGAGQDLGRHARFGRLRHHCKMNKKTRHATGLSGPGSRLAEYFDSSGVGRGIGTRFRGDACGRCVPHRDDLRLILFNNKEV